MDFHLISEKNIAQVESLWDYCFEKKDSYFFKWYFKEYCLKQNAVLGGFNKQGVLSTMVHLNPYTLKLRGMEAVTSYLVGVATDPAARGRRATKELFEMAFAILKAQGRFFVILMPAFTCLTNLPLFIPNIAMNYHYARCRLVKLMIALSWNE